MQNGELIVIASGNIEIKLKKKPSKTKVKFKDVIQVPCNPGNNDNLSYKIIKKNNSHFLYIEWNVSSIRKIIWETSF